MSPASGLPNEIRGVMLPITGGRVLVPNTNMAEVITYARPEPVEGAPAWLLGRLAWRGWRLPVLSFSVLTGTTSAEPTENTRVAILKALGGHPTLPYFGVLTQGFPRLTLITDNLLQAGADGGAPLPGVREQVSVHDESAWIPDLGDIEAQVVAALQAAA